MLDATCAVLTVSGADARVWVMLSVRLRRHWFEAGPGMVHLMVWHGSKPLPLDQVGNTSAEARMVNQFCGVFSALTDAVRAGASGARLSTLFHSSTAVANATSGIFRRCAEGAALLKSTVSRLGNE